MPNLNDYFKGTFLKAADLKGKTVKVTIAEIGEFESQEGKVQPTITFKETELVLGLNKTNAMTIADLTGSTDLTQWIGHRIAIFPTKTDFGGKRVDCIRVRDDFHEAPTGNGKAKAQPERESRPAQSDDPYPDNIFDEEVPF